MVGSTTATRCSPRRDGAKDERCEADAAVRRGEPCEVEAARPVADRDRHDAARVAVPIAVGLVTATPCISLLPSVLTGSGPDVEELHGDAAARC